MATLKHCSRAILLCLILQTLFNLSLAYRVSHDGRAITIDGERKILLSGSIHYPRSTPGVCVYDSMYILFVEIFFLFEFLMLTYRRYLV